MNNKVILAFWLYIISDCIMFSCLFLSFLIKKKIFFFNKIYNFRILIIQTLILLICSNFSLKIINSNKDKYYILNILFSILFLLFEYKDFIHLYFINLTYFYNNFFSNYYLILFFHFLHVIFSIFFNINIYILFLIKLNFKKNKIIYSMFWHFIHIIWLIIIFIILN